MFITPGAIRVPPAPEDRLWLFGIARRVLANAARAERRRRRLTERLKHEPGHEHVEPAGLAQALAALGRTDRELLLLTGWEGLTPAEIARVLRRPAARASSRGPPSRPPAPSPRSSCSRPPAARPTRAPP